jgi:F-type H+-transporting ATPase subunit gamma
METRKLAQRLETQRQAVACVERAAADLLAFHPNKKSVPGLHPVCLLIGSNRGFCGDFNEQVLRVLQEPAGVKPTPGTALIAVGYRLSAKLAGDSRLAATLEGADVAEETDAVLGGIVAALSQLRENRGPVSLTAVYQQPETAAVAKARLLPPFQDHMALDPGFSCPPLLNLDPTEFLVNLVDHYLLATLHEVLCASLMAENRRRMQHLEGALRHLDERVEYLRRRGRQVRQEEIIEEIEVILLGAALDVSSGNPSNCGF